MSLERVIIDVRDPFEYASGHAEGAINIPPSALMSGAQQLEDLDTDSELIVYCKTCSRSTVSLQLLKQLGFTTLFNAIHAGPVPNHYLS